MGRLIDGDALKRQYEERKRLFCRNRIEFSTLSDKDKARVDELDNCIADILNAPTIEPEPKWIACVDGNEPKANAECWISTSAKYVRRASYAPKANNQPNGFIVTVGGFGFYEYGKSAKAWMPYTKEPEPYREEGER